jgi:signal transduction histidine kinase
MKRYLAYLKGDVIYSSAVTWIVGIWSVWTHVLAKAPDINGNIYLRIVLAAFSIVPAVVILNLYKIATRNKKRTYFGILTAIILAGFSRGLILAVMFKTFGITENYNFTFRVPNGLVLISFAYIIATILVSVYTEQRDLLYSLRTERSRLISAASELRGKRLQEEAHLQEEINDLLLREVKNLNAQLSKEIIISLQKLINDIVRPISHNLANQIPKWIPEDFAARPDRISIREILLGIKPENAINIRILSTLMLLQTLPFISLYGWVTVLKIELTILILFPMSLIITQTLLVRLTAKMTPSLRLFFIFASLGISAVPTGSVIYFLIRNSPDPYYFLKAGPSFTMLAAGLIITSTALQNATKNVREELSKTNDELRWIIARKNLVIWNLRGSLSRNLHGPIQSAIQVSVFDLRKAVETDALNADLIERIQKNISEAIYNLNATNRKSVGVQQVFDDVVETWRDHCNIAIHVSDETLEALTQDPAAKSASEEIVREFVSNALRHAEAKNVEIQITLTDKCLLISATNDGFEFNEESSKGLGLGLLDSIAVSSSVARLGDKTLVSAEIPLLI